ncbi:phage holin [Paenibacillus sp. XY044]|uniref:phage holin n=1 Tax=Paenibacillus sp. XY044 TaxID=2026089 RepID=UPI000B98CB56|nr:phage holin [Paenibacillus sp. XY044]OZB90046.1 phage holin [Paenibacillus sp. XY044]
MQSIWDQVSPLLSGIIVEIIKLLCVLVLAGFGYLQIKAKASIDTMKNKAQRELFHKIADEAFAYAEATFKNESSRNKLNKAFTYASSKLSDVGIKLSVEEITAAIEKACLEYNANKNKTLKDGDKAS